MNRTILKLATSVLIIGAVGAATANDITPKMLKQAEKASTSAIKAMKEHNRAAAVRYAEQAVLYNPGSADNRALLGQAYMQAGRFVSADTAFSDALRLNADYGRAALGLGLVKVARGDTAAALAALAQARGHVPDVDLGLALALAGDHQGSLAVLEPAARADGATAKARQNLALAYALAGRWADARVTAAQDISPAQVDQRMIQWAQFANPRGSADQLASLLGTKSVMDGGMPSQLALIDTQPGTAPAAVAIAEPQPEAQPAAIAVSQPVPAEAAPVETVPAVQTAELVVPAAAPAQAALQPVPVENPAPVLVTAAAATPVRVQDDKPMLVKPLAVAPSRPLVMASAPAAFTKDSFVVQLGAFSTQDRLEHAWDGAVKQVSWLSGYSPVSTTFALSDTSRTLYRLAISGFGSRIEAVNLCRKMREQGSDCFVRGRAGDAPVQWVSRKADAKYAAR